MYTTTAIADINIITKTAAVITPTGAVDAGCGESDSFLGLADCVRLGAEPNGAGRNAGAGVEGGAGLSSIGVVDGCGERGAFTSITGLLGLWGCIVFE